MELSPMGISIFVGIIVVVYGLITYNSIIKVKNNVEETFSTIDVYLKKRYDLVPNLVATVKGYAKHEKELLENVTKLRASLMKADSSNGAVMMQENLLGSMLGSIMMIGEDYPDLKASDNFLELQTELADIENNIAAARRTYNSAVKELRNYKQMIPSKFVAGMMNIKKYDMFEARPAEKINVEVNL